MPWCVTCQHGVPGDVGQECPECISKLRENPSLLITPEEAVERTRKRAEAIKLTRKKTIKGHKSQDEIEKEIEAKVIANITKRFDLVPRTRPEVVRVERVEPEELSQRLKLKKGSGTPKVSEGSGKPKTLKGDSDA